MNGKRMFGIETEYAVTGRDRSGAVVPPETVASLLLDHASTHLPNAQALDSGIFLQNGSRLYVDAGYHPEYSSPECCHPWDFVRYANAGDLILQRLSDELRKTSGDLSEVLVFKGNVDYSGAATSWGSHESYLHRADPSVVQQRLIPHLVSRVIYTGAGGFNPHSPGLEFTLSPRAHHILEVVSHESTNSRGLVHTRDESLSSFGYRRQHLICGDSLRSERASWLRAGTTALIIAMIEAGVPCGCGVVPVAPLDALRTFARDVSCTATTLTASGERTAIQIQKHYLSLARAHAHESFMPAWASAVCREWSNLLDRLENGPEKVMTTLDWAFKWSLYKIRAKRFGVEWEMLPMWTHFVQVLTAAFNLRRSTGDQRGLTALNPDVITEDGPFNVALALGSEGSLPNEVRALMPYFESRQLRWRQLDTFLKLRQQLLEIDLRFGQIGERTLFNDLEHTSFRGHRMPGVDRVAEAMNEPPIEGRARVRGQVIRLSSQQGTRVACTWNRIYDLDDSSRNIDLSDPFMEQEVWKRESSPHEEAEVGLWARLMRSTAGGIGRSERLGGRIRPNERTRPGR